MKKRIMVRIRSCGFLRIFTVAFSYFWPLQGQFNNPAGQSLTFTLPNPSSVYVKIWRNPHLYNPKKSHLFKDILKHKNRNIIRQTSLVTKLLYHKVLSQTRLFNFWSFWQLNLHVPSEHDLILNVLFLYHGLLFLLRNIIMNLIYIVFYIYFVYI